MIHLVDLGSAIIALTALLTAGVALGGKKSFWSLSDALVVPVGAIGTVIGVTLMLANLDDPSHVGPAISVAYLTLLYGGILKFGLGIYTSNHTEKAQESPGLRGGAAACLLVTILAAAILLSGSLFMFLDSTALVLCVVAAATTGGLTRAAGKPVLEGLVHHLPWAGLLIFYACVVVLPQVMHDPKNIGPIMAVGLLSLLYTLTGASLIHLVRPDLVGPHPPRSQWFLWIGVSAGVATIMAMLLIAMG